MQSIWIGNMPIQKLPSVTINVSNALRAESKGTAEVSGTCVSGGRCLARTSSQPSRGPTRGDHLKNSPPKTTGFQSFLIRDQNKSCRSRFNFDNLESLKERLRASISMPEGKEKKRKLQLKLHPEESQLSH